MQRARTLAALGSLSALTLCCTVRAAPTAPLRPGVFQVELIRTTLAPEVVATFKTLRVALSRNAALTRALIAKTPRGTPLPYRSWFGVTKNAYEKAVTAQPYSAVTGKTTLRITRLNAAGTLLALSGGAGLEKLNGLQLDLLKNTARTPWGTTASGRGVSIAAPGDLGPREGTSWLIEEGSAQSGTVTNVNLSVLRLAKTGRTLISYQVAVMRDSLVRQRFVVDLLVPRP